MTDKPRVLLTRRLPDNVEARANRDYRATVNPSDALMSGAQIVEAAQGHEAIICCATEAFTADVINALPSETKILATFSVGYEHIDIDAAHARGLVVTNTPDAVTNATADITMLCLLGAARRGAQADALVRAGGWDKWSSTMMLGMHVTGKRLGIFGMGRIGRAVAQRARGFDMQVHYHNRSRLEPDQELGAVYHESAESLLPVSDFLCINAPSSPDTIKFLNAERIALLPQGAVIVNTARGNLVDDDALVEALESGKVFAAGLDVYDGEPNIHPGYVTCPNTFLLPHLGSATHDTRDHMGFLCLDNLDAYFAARPCPNAVAPPQRPAH
jgi:lactate dehydrogenase-like 2-hydroxyacid dehydrogenase